MASTHIFGHGSSRYYFSHTVYDLDFVLVRLGQNGLASLGNSCRVHDQIGMFYLDSKIRLMF